LVFTAAIFGSLSLLNLYLVVACRRCVEVYDWGLRFLSPFGESSVRWDEIQSVVYSDANAALDISVAGRSFRVYLYCMHGTSRLRWALERHAAKASEPALRDPRFDRVVPRLL